MGVRWLRQGCSDAHPFYREHRLTLYVAEFQFRYNNRKNADISERRIEGC